MKLSRSFALATSFPLVAITLSVSDFPAVSANVFGQGDDHPSNNGRRVGKLGAKTSASASSANCATGLDIQLYEDSDVLTFSASARACRSGKAYAGATADGKQQISLVPGSTPGTNTFTASVNDVETGAVYSIAPDGNGDMMVVERFQEDFGEELDAVDELSPEERKLLDEANLSGDSSNKVVVDFTSGLRGKAVANQFKDLGDKFIAEQQGERDLQGNTIIDVLVLWTAHAECRTSSFARGCTRTTTTEANMRARINLAMAETNTAYAESGVNVELNLVHAYYTTYVEDRGFSQALYDLQGTTDVYITDVHDKRTQYGADVVAMLIDDSQYCGIAFLGPSKTSMFSVTAWNCATGYYSFGHEIGHNMGCHHDRGTTSSCTSSNHNFGWRDPQASFRSILAYNCVSGQCDNNSGGGCPRVMRFSNPTFPYNGSPIGNSQNNNAKVLNDNSAVVAGYYSSTPAPTNEPTKSLQPTSPTVTKYVCGKFQPANDEICANGSVADATCDAEKAASGVSCGNGGKKCWQADGCVGSPPAPAPTPTPPTGGCPVCAATGDVCCGDCIDFGKPSGRGCF